MKAPLSMQSGDEATIVGPVYQPLSLICARFMAIFLIGMMRMQLIALLRYAQANNSLFLQLSCASLIWLLAADLQALD